jgi:hypothetical protein
MIHDFVSPFIVQRLSGIDYLQKHLALKAMAKTKEDIDKWLRS